MAGKEEMLERVRRALGHPPSVQDGSAPGGLGAPPLPVARLEGVMPPITPEECVEKFEKELGNVNGITHRAATSTELEEFLRKILSDAGAKSAALTRNPLLTKLGLAEKLHAWGISTLSWPLLSPNGGAKASADKNYRDHCFAVEVGISGVDFVLAETGSLVVSSETEGSQLASLAPPVHVALYRRAQAVSSLDDVLERSSASWNPGSTAPGRSVVFITGPSRTADIEQILIRGVHGPREVHAILVEESCFSELASAAG